MQNPNVREGFVSREVSWRHDVPACQRRAIHNNELVAVEVEIQPQSVFLFKFLYSNLLRTILHQRIFGHTKGATMSETVTSTCSR